MKQIILIITLLLLFAANIFFGAVHIPMDSVTDVLCGADVNTPTAFIILQSRLPQAITAIFAGAGLAVAGLILQTMFRNPLAGPSILGITSGASLGVAIVMLVLGSFISIGESEFSGGVATTIGAFGGSMAIMALLITLASRLRNNLTLLIVGMMTGYLSSSIVTLLSSVSTSKSLHGYVIWGMGTFSGVGLDDLPLYAGTMSICLLCSLLLVKPLNLLLLGDNYAINLGLNLRRTRFILLLVTGILTAVITAACGPIGFIGLAMPHIARLIFKTDNHLVLMPATMLCGAILALGCNLLSVAVSEQVIPINALTPIAGIPVVLYIIMKKR